MKEIDYATGVSGFLGTHLQQKIDLIAIPHQEIDSIKLKPFKSFFFMSTYGNMAGHETEDLDLVVKANLIDLTKILSQTDFENGVRSFVYISTSSVTRHVQTMYSRSKKAAEEILLGYMEKYNAPICIARPYSITGVGEQKDHLIPKLIDSCLNGTQMPFAPDPVHDFIDVDDVVDGLLILSKHHARGIYDLGTGIGFSNETVREMVEDATGKKTNVTYVKNLRPYDSDDWYCKNFNARAYGWRPKKTLEQSIIEMVEYAKRT